MKAKIIFISLLLIGAVNFLFGQVLPDSTQLSAYHHLSTKYDDNISVHWSETNGSPDIITFSSPVVYDKNQEKSVRDFLKEIHSLFKFRVMKDSLVLVKQKNNKGIEYFRYQQTYKNIPVKGGEYVVTVLEDGRIRTALGSFYKDIQISGESGITYEEALVSALKNPPDNRVLRDSLISYDLAVYPDGENFYLVYELHVPGSKDGESWCYVIDAVNGNVINISDDMIYSQAYAYLRHPGLDASYTTISPLNNIYDNGYLRGTYAYILNSEGSAAYNASNDFRYSTDNTHFDEANLYYHVDKVADFFRDMGFDEFTQIIAYAHYDFYDDGDPSPNASYNSSDHKLRFSDGQGVSGYNSFAREDKIIYHEYTHAVTDYVADLVYSYTESGAIHEGNSDYFAASLTEREVIGEYACSAYQRDISNPLISNYFEYISDPDFPDVEPHDGGELWSVCLWDLRGELGSTVTDELIFDGLSAIPTTCTFLQYRQAIINADINNNDGCNVNSIKHVFYLRGIGTDEESVTISGTLQSDETWYCTQTLSGNVTVPSGMTLTINSGATVTLNGHSIISTGGTISRSGGATISGLRATLTANTVLRGLCSSIQAAATNATSTNEIWIVAGNFNENVSISNKYSLSIFGNYDYMPFGRLTVTNCDCFYGYNFRAGSVYINNASYVMLSDLTVYGADLSTIGFTLYNSETYFADNLSAQNLQAGITCTDGTEADIGQSLLMYNLRGVDSYNGSNVGVYYTRFCGTALDLKTYNFSSIDAGFCYYDGGTPSTSGSNITHNGDLSCPVGKSILQTENSNDAISIAEENSSDFGKINSSYFALNKRLSNAFKEKTEFNKEAFCADYEQVITDFKEYIRNNPDSPLARLALIATAKSYRRIDDLRGKSDFIDMKNFLDDVIENPGSPALKQQAERQMLDYYRLTNDFTKAIETADKIMEKYKEDADYVCGVLYGKGLILSHETSNKEDAASCFSEIMKNYGDNPLTDMAANELRILGETVEEEKNIETTESEGITLSANPNPFNPSTNLTFNLPEEANVGIVIYDLLGRKVWEQARMSYTAGKHTVTWQGVNKAGQKVSTGTYIVRLQSEKFNATQKILLMK